MVVGIVVVDNVGVDTAVNDTIIDVGIGSVVLSIVDIDFFAIKLVYCQINTVVASSVDNVTLKVDIVGVDISLF